MRVLRPKKIGKERERKCEKERLFSIFWKKIDMAVYTLSYRPFGYIFRSTLGKYKNEKEYRNRPIDPEDLKGLEAAIAKAKL